MTTDMVIDTSIAIKWIKQSDESDVPKALEFYEKIKAHEVLIAVPDIIFYEITNFASRQPEETYNACLELVNFIVDSEIEIVPPNKEFMFEVATLAKELKISSYDAAYLVVAKILDTKLLTADKKLLSSAPDLTTAL